MGNRTHYPAVRHASDIWNTNSETFRNNADARRMEIDNRTQHVRNIVEMLYKQGETEESHQTAIKTQAENELAASPMGPGGERADAYAQQLEMMKMQEEINNERDKQKNAIALAEA